MKQKKLQYIFVHGLVGWGSYDKANKSMPYWGMRGGDLMKVLRSRGFDCYAASVDPLGSAWDRACELYAQIAGARTDYGKAHSRRYRHERFGKDFSDCPLIPEWNTDTRLVLLGHSFGGTTIRLFSELLAHGDEEEKQSGEVSPLFAGGIGERVHSIAALASPMNGTTAYETNEDPFFDLSSVRIPLWSKAFRTVMIQGTKPKPDGRDESDYANFDMHLDHAAELNRRISVLPHVYYYSVPFSMSEKSADGTFRPKKRMEPLFVVSSCQIGAYRGCTPDGIMIDENWLENDGIVNTISERAPFHDPQKEYDPDHIEPGVWNVLPTVRGDHMWPQGGMVYKHDIRKFYTDLLTVIEAR